MLKIHAIRRFEVIEGHRI